MSVYVRGAKGSPPVDITDQVARAIERKLRESEDIYFMVGDTLQLTLEMPIVVSKL